MINKIMVIDDFAIIRSNLKKILSDLGAKQITEACDGVEAFEKINLPENKANPFELIFLDWNMPRMNGYDFLKELKGNDLFKSIPIIMTTAERERKSIIAALSAGASDYIVKPFNQEIINEKIKKFSSLQSLKKIG